MLLCDADSTTLSPPQVATAIRLDAERNAGTGSGVHLVEGNKDIRKAAV